jgi:hypothetical protein
MTVNAILLLRIASVVALLFALGHTSGSPWTPTEEPSAASVVEAMKSVSFDVMGSNRSYWEFYLGFGLSISVYMLAQAAFLWLLATLAKTQPASVRPFLAVLLASYAINGFFAWRYFFVLPLVLSVVMVICLALALFASRRRIGT